MPNRLAGETSPYLLQHANNPVDWYPWGEEALARAHQEDRPILLSIGYSACHWCHVMERESFENPDIAQLMNENFVNIKVDREERPDLDSIYMAAVQGMTGHGGWPMTVFLTPDGAPFYGGTYFPPSDRGQMPGFPRVLLSVAEAYREKRADIARNAAQVREFLERQTRLQGGSGELGAAALDTAFGGLLAQFDQREGGFGGAPKFPQPMSLDVLIRQHLRTGDPRARQMVELSLDKMAHGGLYDQLGGGFHRYAVDAVWLIPHFEKMLYDNAQLAALYLHAYQLGGNRFYREVTEQTLDYVLREMTSPEGGFYSTQDADSEGEEGKFFAWTADEIVQAVGQPDARVLLAYFGVQPGGNFEGRSVLYVPAGAEVVAQRLGLSVAEVEAAVERGRRRLFEQREARIKPARDEKILTAWNGLMLKALAEAAAVLERDDYLQAARKNADFVLSSLLVDGRLRRTFKDGRARLNAYLEDYSFYADGLLALHQATAEPRWYQAARGLVASLLEHFWDADQGCFYDTSGDHERLVSRPRDVFDNATPSGNAVAVEVLLRLAALTGAQRYHQIAERVLRSLAEPMTKMPAGFGRLLGALDTYLAPPREVAIVGPPEAAETLALLRVFHERYRPNTVLARSTGPSDPLAAELPVLEGRDQRDGQATSYVCEHYACQAPTVEPAELRRQLAAH